MNFVCPSDEAFEKQVIIDEANDVITHPNVVLFWGGWASQWYPSQFSQCGITFNCAEQYMMYTKATFLGDLKTADLILNEKYPKSQKELGRAAGPWNPRWDDNAMNTVIRGNILKFSQNKELGDLLQATGDRLIAEASPYDDVWGIGMGVGDPDVLDPTKWKGQNNLGKALMTVRERERNARKPW